MIIGVMILSPTVGTHQLQEGLGGGAQGLLFVAHTLRLAISFAMPTFIILSPRNKDYVLASQEASSPGKRM